MVPLHLKLREEEGRRELDKPKKCELSSVSFKEKVMEKQAYKSLVVLFALALCVAWTGAQNVGSIEGAVTDATGAVLPGVEIELQNVDTGNTRVLVSNDEGNYRAQNLGLGTYQVSASLPGFQTAVRSGIVLTIGRQAVVDLQLAIGEISERVEVVGDAPLVETTNSQLSALWTDSRSRICP
jgi:hypothetical protein